MKIINNFTHFESIFFCVNRKDVITYQTIELDTMREMANEFPVSVDPNSNTKGKNPNKINIGILP
jgi:hypothetical protein